MARILTSHTIKKAIPSMFTSTQSTFRQALSLGLKCSLSKQPFHAVSVICGCVVINVDGLE